MPHAIIHVGTMKTGSSSIQRCLLDNPEPLAERGYTYLGWPARDAAKIAAKLDALDASRPNVVVSDEGLWHFMDTSRSKTREIAALLAEYEVQIVVYLRRPDHFLNSWYLQGLKTGTGAKTFSGFLESPFVQRGLDFLEKLRRLKAYFGVETLTIRAYEPSQLIAGDVVRDFLDVTGFDHTAFRLPPRINQQPESTDATLIRAVLSILDRPDDGDVTTGDQLLEHLGSRGYEGRSYLLFTHAEISELSSQFSPVFEEIHDVYGAGVSPLVFNDWIDADGYVESVGSLRALHEAAVNAAPTD